MATKTSRRQIAKLPRRCPAKDDVSLIHALEQFRLENPERISSLQMHGMTEGARECREQKPVFTYLAG